MKRWSYDIAAVAVLFGRGRPRRRHRRADDDGRGRDGGDGGECRPACLAEDDDPVKGMRSRTDIDAGPVSVVDDHRPDDQAVIVLRRDAEDRDGPEPRRAGPAAGQAPATPPSRRPTSTGRSSRPASRR